MSNFFSRLFGLFTGKKREKNYRNLEELLGKEKFSKLQDLIGFRIKEQEYFVRALVHRSYLEQNEDFEYSNERLEFLGDAVLSLTVAEYLYRKFPDEDEGFLTKVRSKFVNKLALAEAAEDIDISQFLLLGKNLLNNFNQNSKTIISDAFEALIGAVYLDGGPETASRFIYGKLIEPFAKTGLHLVDENYKSQLLEYAQAKKYEPPVYSVIREEGPHHNKIFTIKVTINGEDYGIGKGKSKKVAEQNAAESAFKKITAAGSTGY